MQLFRVATGFLSFFIFFIITPSFASSSTEVIRIGVPSPLSGIYASDARGYRQCLEFALEEINSTGGILGKQLEMVTYDIGVLSPEKLMAAAVVLIEQQKVDSIHGGWSGWGQNVRAFGKYPVPTFFADASISSITEFRKHPEKYNNIFQMCDVEKPLAIGVLDMMNGLDYTYPNRKVVIIATDDDWGYRIRKAMENSSLDKGWNIAMSEVVPYGIKDWEALLTKIRDINPAWIHLEIASPPDVKAFLDQFNKKPTQSLVNLGYGLMPPNLVNTLGDRANGLLGKVVFTMPLPNGPTPQSQQWLNRFRTKYGSAPTTAGYLSYVSLKMWAAAVVEVGDEKAYDEINSKLLQMTYSGIGGGVWRFDEDQKIPMSTNTPMLGMQVQDGRLVTICEISDKVNIIHPFQIPTWVK
jgi:branched-chain amino acid transport system substrate-binding protein